MAHFLGIMMGALIAYESITRDCNLLSGFETIQNFYEHKIKEVRKS